MVFPIFLSSPNDSQVNLANLYLNSSLDELKQMIKNWPLVCYFSQFASQIDQYLLEKENEPERLKQEMEILETLIKEQAETNHSAPEGLLYLLIENNYDLIAEKLIRLGISTIHSKNGYYQNTPLHLACQKGKLQLVQALIDQEADVNALNHVRAFARENYKMTPLGSCLDGLDSIKQSWPLIEREAYIQIIDLLLSRGADPKKGHINQSSFLNTCLMRGWNDIAWKVINSADLNFEDPVLHLRPIHLAVTHNLQEIALKLLQEKVDIHTFCSESLWSTRSVTSLHLAVMKRDPVIVEALLKAGADANLRAINLLYGENVAKAFSAPEPLTPYMMAVDFNDAACIQAFLKYYHPTQLDTGFPGNRSSLRAPFEDVCRHGYVSLPLRLKTETAKRALKVFNVSPPLRCSSCDDTLIPLIETVLNQFVRGRDLPAIEKICRPLFNRVIQEFEKNEDLHLYFLKTDALPKQLGCYNADTGNELIFNADELRTLNDMLPVIVHEFTHKLAHMIYSPSSAPKSHSFSEAIQRDIQHLQNATPSEGHFITKMLFDTVLQYPELQHKAEYLVRIPQVATIIALRNPKLHQEELEKIMETNLPHSFSFFMNEFLPSVNAKQDKNDF